MPSSNAAKLWWKRSSDRLTVASARAATVDRNASPSGVARTPRCRPWRNCVCIMVLPYQSLGYQTAEQLFSQGSSTLDEESAAKGSRRE